MRAVQISEFGGPGVLEVVDVPTPEPAADEVLVRVTRAGMNFADTHTRENSYLAEQQLPLIPGAEVAGVVERGYGPLAEGQRVVCLLASGGYAEYATVPVASAHPIPEGLEDGAALSLVLQGLTAWHLYRTSAQLRAGESVVVHAAAGGVGSIAVQLGRSFGAGRVIATASTEQKRQLALQLGAHAAVDVNSEDLASALREANEGRRVDVVLEMAGGDVFDSSLEALAPFGRLVAYGMASREQRKVSNAKLMRTSGAVVGFWLAHCLGRPEMVGEPLADLFKRTLRGDLRPMIGTTYGLSEVRRAHEDIQGRRTQGKLLLNPAR